MRISSLNYIHNAINSMMINESYTVLVNTQPRTTNTELEEHLHKDQKKPWHFNNSLFKDYNQDHKVILKTSQLLIYIKYRLCSMSVSSLIGSAQRSHVLSKNQKSLFKFGSCFTPFMQELKIAINTTLQLVLLEMFGLSLKMPLQIL